jgi:flagellin
MPTVINTNLASLYAQNNLSNAQNSLANSVMRLSSGLRINGAKDDAAGLAISQSMQTQINGVNQSRRNLNDATNLIQVADTSLGTIHDMLLRMKTLTTQGYDGSLSASQRTQIVDEINELNTEINATAARTKFNKNNLIAATASGTVSSGGYTIGSAGYYGSIVNVNANTSLFGTFTLTADNNNLSISGTISSTYGGVTTSATYTQTLEMTGYVATAGGYQTINFDQLGISLDVLLNPSVSESKSVTFKTLTAGQTVTIGSKIFTAGAGGASDIQVAQSFRTGVAVNGAFDAGTHTNWDASGTAGTAIVTFTSSTLNDDLIGASDVSTSLSTATTGTALGVTNTNGRGSANDLASGLNGKLIRIDNNAPADLVFQGGADTSTPNMITFDAINIRTDSTAGGLQAMNNLGGQVNLINSFTNTTAQTAWATAFSTLGTFVDAAVDLVSEQRSVMGALQNRISYINQNLEAYSTNLQSSRSAIMDADFAAETAKLTKGQILQQAATAMLAQANQMPNIVLSLLK